MYRAIISLLIFLSLLAVAHELSAQERFWTETSLRAGLGRIVAIAATRSTVMMVATEHDGIYRSFDNGFTWFARNNGLASTEMRGLALYDALNPDAVASTSDGRTFFTTDGGANWTPALSDRAGVKIGTMGSNLEDVIAAAEHGIMLRKGNNFTGDSVPYWVSGGLSEWSIVHVAQTYTIAYYSYSSTVWFLITSEGKILRGRYTSVVPDTIRYYPPLSWSLLPRAFPGATALAGMPTEAIYTGTRSLYRSIDLGDTWEKTSYNGDSITAIALNSWGHLFVGTPSGVYRSTDRGDTWEQINMGLLDTNITVLTVDSRGYIFAGTASGKVYRSMTSTSTLSADEVKSLPRRLDLR